MATPKRKEPSLAIMLGMPKGKDEPDGDEEESPESGDVESEIDPAVDAKLSEAFPDMSTEQKEALHEAFKLCFEQWEREPHEEAEHEGY
jgi:hypothetical protein